MNTHTVSLNGQWYCDYIGGEAYTSAEEPAWQVRPATPLGDAVRVPVPAYWEDLWDEFRKTALHTRLMTNPLYTLQRYPQSGYVPDMALPNPVGSFFYKRKVTLTAEQAAMPAVLAAGGVQNALSAWVNGVFIGRHEGYSTPFALDIPAGLLREGENSLTLAVSNTRLAGYAGRPISGLTSRAACECTGGIYGDLSLRFLPDGIRDVYVRTAEDLAAFTVYTEGGEDCERRVTVTDGRRTVATAVIPAGEASVTLPRGGLSLWSPDEPTLYTAIVTGAHTRHTCRFGLRRLAAVGTGLYLNGEPFYFRGTCEHCYHPVTVHPTRDKGYYRAVLRRLKSLGFNSIRFHTYIPMEEYLEAADELGMVLELETPNNTTLAEWGGIVRLARRHASALAISSGNEMMIDEDYIEHLRAAATAVHAGSDMLFSPMSAMRGIEYFKYGEGRVDTPFPHDAVRLAALSEFCDLYNSYSLGSTSYNSTTGRAEVLDRRHTAYDKPLLSHEICIHGTYADLSLEERYRGTRIGDTELFSSVRRHLADRGLLDRAPLYYRNSSVWQAALRKDCFELCRRTASLSGYDFLGDIDTHWHTFGYCVGMMNEFYELKPGESEENVRRYNADTVLLCDLPALRNLTAGERVALPILASHFGKPLPSARLSLRISDGRRVILRRTVNVGALAAGVLREIYRAELTLPRTEKPLTLTLTATLAGGDTDAENVWQLYVFPKASALPSERTLRAAGLTVSDGMGAGELLSRLANGERVLLLGGAPFPTEKTSYQPSVAGRTNGHLATVLSDHPVLRDFPHEGYCGHQFAKMLADGAAIVLDRPDLPFAPIAEIATTYKNARREALIAEYRVGRGRLLVCGLRLDDADPAARYLRERLVAYAAGDEFAPRIALTLPQLADLLDREGIDAGENENAAMNKNDITV